MAAYIIIMHINDVMGYLLIFFFILVMSLRACGLTFRTVAPEALSTLAIPFPSIIDGPYSFLLNSHV